jgi:hypothetical protein
VDREVRELMPSRNSGAAMSTPTRTSSGSGPPFHERHREQANGDEQQLHHRRWCGTACHFGENDVAAAEWQRLDHRQATKLSAKVIAHRQRTEDEDHDAHRQAHRHDHDLGLFGAASEREHAR